jgi:hypothetical protein
MAQRTIDTTPDHERAFGLLVDRLNREQFADPPWTVETLVVDRVVALFDEMLRGEMSREAMRVSRAFVAVSIETKDSVKALLSVDVKP